MINIIRNYIKKDPISFIHIEELLDRNYTIIYASENGFIIHDNDVDFTYISFSDVNEMKEVLTNHHYDHYLAYDKEIVEYFNDEGKTTNLYQYAFLSKEKFDVSEYDIRKLGLEYLDTINKIYKALGPGEDNKDALVKDEVLGIFENNELAGFIGRHPEGCLGMLHIFEKYRRKGYGEALEKAKINDLLDRKQRVFEEVIEGNEASLALQTKLGFTKGDKTIYWKI